MQAARRMLVVVALVGGMLATAAPAQADEGCQIMGPEYVEGAVDCVRYILVTAIGK